jgi:hypothetical protein
MKVPVSGRIRDIDPRPKDSDRSSAVLEGSPMGNAIDAPRHAAHHRYAGANKGGGQGSGCALSVRCRVSRSNDRNARCIERRGVAKSIEWGGGSGEIEKLRRIFGRAPLPDLDTGIIHERSTA